MLDCSHSLQVMKLVPHVKFDLELWVVKGDLEPALLWSTQNNTVLACRGVKIVSAKPYKSIEYEVKYSFEVANLDFRKKLIELHEKY